MQGIMVATIFSMLAAPNYTPEKFCSKYADELGVQFCKMDELTGFKILEAWKTSIPNSLAYSCVASTLETDGGMQDLSRCLIRQRW